MRKFILLSIFFIYPNYFNSQIVNSSCSAPGNIMALYIDDADRLALKRIYQQNLTYTNSITIPQTIADTVLKALIAVYNATALPARNAVVSNYSIHTFPYPIMKALNVVADSTLPWMNQLKLGNIPTGNSQIDNLLSNYNLTIQNYNNYYGIMLNHVVTFKSLSNYNMVPLTNLFNNIPSVAFSETVNVIGDGNTISASIYPNFVQLIYSIGWGDCLAGCIYRHYWEFLVYYDCSVEFVGEFGSSIPVAQTPSISVLGSNCTNSTLTVSISGANSYSLNNQPIYTPQFTLSSPTPISYTVFTTNNSFPAYSSFSVSFSFIKCNTNSITENKWLSNIVIFPNPAKDFIEFHLEGNLIAESFHKVEIWNNFGQLIEDVEISGNNYKISTHNFSPGIYFLRLQTRTGETVNKRFVLSQ